MNNQNLGSMVVLKIYDWVCIAFAPRQALIGSGSYYLGDVLCRASSKLNDASTIPCAPYVPIVASFRFLPTL